MQILLFKRTLRVSDHLPLMDALAKSASLGKVLCLYVHEPSLIADPLMSRQHQQFTLECLDALQEDLQSIGGHLHEAVDEIIPVMQSIIRAFKVTRVVSYRETSQRLHFERDRALAAFLKAHSIPWDELPSDNVIRGSEPDALKMSFQAYFDASVQQELPNPLGQSFPDAFYLGKRGYLDRSRVPQAAGEDKSLRMRGGRTEAKKHAALFFTGRKLKSYPYSLSSPLKAIQGTSHLSPYLALGVISDRQVMAKINDLVSSCHGQVPAVEFEKIQSAARFFLDRLIWRQGYFQQFEHCPELEYEEFFEGFKGLREQEYREEFWLAWKHGLTGVPFIDATQRCLQATGWINMRARACLTSYACMQLWLPWPKVAQHLANQFIDFCAPIHFGQVRIASGTSHFSRLLAYDPIKQTLDHDPKAVFIKTWVPELRALPTEKACFPWLLQDWEQEALGFKLGRDYPRPLVENRLALDQAKARVAEIRRHPIFPVS